jgi:hypothetical protein
VRAGSCTCKYRLLVALIDVDWHGQDPLAVFVALAGLIERPAWHRDAACREHPELSWFPHKGDSTKAQRAICASCLVRAECAEASIGERDGLWGGASIRERRKIRQGLPVQPRRQPVVIRERQPVSAKTAYMREYRARKAREVA